MMADQQDEEIDEICESDVKKTKQMFKLDRPEAMPEGQFIRCH